MSEIAATVALGTHAGSSTDRFGRLEERVVCLVERYREAQKSLEELDRRLRAAEAHASRLECELAERDLLRDDLRARLDRVIGWVQALESANEAAGEAASE
jgi:chromosome segregation ATPase